MTWARNSESLTSTAVEERRASMWTWVLITRDFLYFADVRLLGADFSFIVATWPYRKGHDDNRKYIS